MNQKIYKQKWIRDGKKKQCKTKTLENDIGVEKAKIKFKSFLK